MKDIQVIKKEKEELEQKISSLLNGFMERNNIFEIDIEIFHNHVCDRTIVDTFITPTIYETGLKITIHEE